MVRLIQCNESQLKKYFLIMNLVRTKEVQMGRRPISMAEQ